MVVRGRSWLRGTDVVRPSGTRNGVPERSWRGVAARNSPPGLGTSLIGGCPRPVSRFPNGSVLGRGGFPGRDGLPGPCGFLEAVELLPVAAVVALPSAAVAGPVVPLPGAGVGASERGCGG